MHSSLYVNFINQHSSKSQSDGFLSVFNLFMMSLEDNAKLAFHSFEINNTIDHQLVIE